MGLLEGAQGVQEAYGLALSFGLPLSLYAVLIDGDPLTQTYGLSASAKHTLADQLYRWSIGGAPEPILGLPILGKGDGLSGSHNKYEADASVSRGGMSIRTRLNRVLTNSQTTTFTTEMSVLSVSRSSRLYTI